MPRSSKPTLSDVAARAGVAATTASYILNGRSLEMRISSDTEARVHKAARELGYRPNRTAQSLRTASTRIVGVVTDYVAGGMFSARILAGANAGCRGSILVRTGKGLSEAEARLPIEYHVANDLSAAVDLILALAGAPGAAPSGGAGPPEE